MLLQRKSSKNYAKVFDNPETGDKFALIAFNGDAKEKLQAKLRETYMVQGDHVKSGGKASELSIPMLLAGGSGALGISAATSGTLFMATANPATLMAVGNGVGSAVMGPGGIVAQAPFLPVTGAIMPVAAPLLTFQLLSTIMIMQQFKPINERLINIEKAINRVIQRNEATYIGEVLSAISRLDILEDELSVTNKFTTEMMIRLSLIESSINPIFERYKYLYESQSWDSYLSYDDLKHTQTDAHMSIILSILDLRIDMMRVRLAIQENPGYLSNLSLKVMDKVDRYKKLWNDIEKSPRKVEQVTDQIKEAITDLSWWQKNMPSWLLGKKGYRIEKEKQIDGLSNLNSYKNTEGLLDVVQQAKVMGDSLTDNLQPVSLIYWEDETGKHSYYTNDIVVR